MLNRILVGVDGRQGGRDALALAAVLQRIGGGEIVAVHVYLYDRTVPFPEAPEVDVALQEDLLTQLEAELRAAGVAARTVIARDLAPARALHAAAEREEADVIVVGSSHRAGADRVLAGDDAANTLHGAPCAVAVAPRGYAERAHDLTLIGVGYDGSRESQRALDLACRLAEHADAYVRATTVVAPARPLGLAPSRYPIVAPGHDSARRRGEELLQHALAGAGDRVTPEVAVGKASQILASSSGDLDLLIVGSRDYGPVRRLMLGSTSTHLFRDAACPVLALPRGVAVPDADPRTRSKAPTSRRAAHRP